MATKFFLFLFLSLTAISPLSHTFMLLHTCSAQCENCTIQATNYDLKCGSDGVTYLSLCELECSKEHCNSSLTVAYDGICNGISPNPTPVAQCATPSTVEPACNPFENCDCTYELLLTCGTDGQTYANSCTLDCARKCNKALRIQHYGGCYK